MPVVPVKCPGCGAATEVNDTHGTAVCSYCRMSFVIEPNKEISFATTDRHVVQVSEEDFDIRGGVLIRYHGESRKVIIPHGVVVVGREAFTNMIGIVEVVFPDSVEEIENSHADGEGAFTHCRRLSHVVLSKNLIHIGASAFCDCPMLKELHIPQAVTKIGDYLKAPNGWIINDVPQLSDRFFRGLCTQSVDGAPSYLRVVYFETHESYLRLKSFITQDYHPRLKSIDKELDLLTNKRNSAPSPSKRAEIDSRIAKLIKERDKYSQLYPTPMIRSSTSETPLPPPKPGTNLYQTPMMDSSTPGTFLPPPKPGTRIM